LISKVSKSGKKKMLDPKRMCFWDFFILIALYKVFFYFSAPEAHDLEWKRALSSAQSRGTADLTAAILLSLLVNAAQLFA
jgi:hypothetical protein